MAKKIKMSESELTAQVQMEMQQSIAYIDGELSEQRRYALEYYNGETVGDLAILDENRSKVVSRDVSDTVEWILPALLKVFTAGDDVVRFEPQGPEDEQVAKQATEYCNWIFTRDNPGFQILYTLFKDALIQKNGIAKIYWDTIETVETRSVEGMDDETYTLLISDPDIEILKHTEYPPEIAPPDLSAGVGPVEPLAASGAPGPTHDVEYRRNKEAGKTCIENIPPEEFLISRRAKTVQDAIYVGHRTRKTLSDLIQAGYDKDQVESLQGDDALMDFNLEAVTRYENDLPDDEPEEHVGQNRQVWVEESYIRIDWDGDGIAEMRRIITANQGKTILKKNGKQCNDAWEGLRPFISLTPIIQPHKFFGLSIADTIMDLQTIKSVVMRQTLDNLYLTNNPRNEVSPFVNMDDYLDSRIGGAIRILEGGDPSVQHVRPITVPFVAGSSLPVLEYLDQVKSNRTGVTAYNQGIDANSLNKTASGITQIMSAAQQRIELIARIFAETGVKDLFRMILYTVSKYQHKERIIRLRNEWVPMDPQNWDTEFDTSINVGLGTGNKDQQLMHLNNILALQMQAIQFQGGVNGPFVTAENVYNTAAKIVENTGLKSVELYFTDPAQAQMQPQPEKPDPEMLKLQQQAQSDQANLQLEVEKTKAELELQKQKQQAEFELKRQQMEFDQQLKLAQAQQTAQLASIKAQPAQNIIMGADGAMKELAVEMSTVTGPLGQLGQMISELAQAQNEVNQRQDQQIQQLAAMIGAPRNKTAIPTRGPDGKIASVQIIEGTMQ